MRFFNSLHFINRETPNAWVQLRARSAFELRKQDYLRSTVPQFTVHNASDETSLTKIRPPEIVGWAQVVLSATL